MPLGRNRIVFDLPPASAFAASMDRRLTFAKSQVQMIQLCRSALVWELFVGISSLRKFSRT